MKLLIKTIILLFCFQFSFAGDGINFTNTSFDSAVSNAKSQGKLVFLDFTASWCAPCKKMERETFSNPNLGAFMNKNFVSFKVDNDFFWGMDIADEYNVTAFPTLLVVDSKGNVVKRITGFQTADGLLNQLKPLTH